MRSRMLICAGAAAAIVCGGLVAAAPASAASVHASADASSTADTVIDTIPLSATPERVVVTPDGAYVYIMTGDTAITRVSTADTSDVTRISVGAKPTDMAIDFDGSTLYVVTPGSGTCIKTIDVASSKVSSMRFAIGKPVKNVYAGKLPGMLYVVNESGDTTRIRPAPDGGLVHSFPITRSDPKKLIVDPGRNHLYNLQPKLKRVDRDSMWGTSGGEGSYTVGEGAADLALSPDGNDFYVTNETSNTVSHARVSERAHNKPSTTIEGFAAPGSIAVSPSGRFAYVVNRADGSIGRVNLVTDTIDSTIAVGGHAEDVVFSPDGAVAYVADSASKALKVLAPGPDDAPAIDAGVGLGGAVLAAAGGLAVLSIWRRRRAVAVVA